MRFDVELPIDPDGATEGTGGVDVHVEIPELTTVPQGGGDGGAGDGVSQSGGDVIQQVGGLAITGADWPLILIAVGVTLIVIGTIIYFTRRRRLSRL